MRKTRGRLPAARQAARVAAYSRSSWVILAGAALLVHALYFYQLQHTPFFSVLVGDAQQYDAWAQRIAGGDWIGSGVFYQTPLYPYLLATVFKVAGHHLLIVRALQAVLTSVSCVLLAVAGERFFSRRAGLIAGALLALSPSAIFFDGLIQKSSLDLFLMTALLASMSVFLSETRRRWLVVIGLAMGLLMLNRENARVLFPIVIAWVFLAFRRETAGRRMQWAMGISACAAIVLLPVGLRNVVAGGEFMVSTSQLGPNFYIGNHAGASGTYQPLVEGRGNAAREQEDARRLAETAAHRTLSAGEVSSYWLGRALTDIREQPWAWLRLMGRKLLLTFNGGEIVDTDSLADYAEYSWILRTLGWAGFGVLLPMAALGAWLTRRDWRRLAVLYALAAGLAFAVAIFYVLSRYRFPMEPLLMLFAGAALAALPRLRFEWRGWVPGVLAAAGVAMVASIPMTSAWGGTYYNVGSELVRQGRAIEAIPLLQQAVKIDPSDASAHFNLGLAYRHVNDPDRSVGAFRTASRLRPTDVDTRATLAAALRAQGRRDEALQEFKSTVDQQPDSARAHLNYGVALWESGQQQHALTEYAEAARLAPTDPSARNDFGAALQQLGRSEDAIREYTAAIALDADYAEAHGNLAVALADVGKLDTAREHFVSALRLQPGSFGLHANYADFLHRLGHVDEAVAEYEQAVTLAQAAGRFGDAESLTKTLHAIAASRRRF